MTDTYFELEKVRIYYERGRPQKEKILETSDDEDYIMEMAKKINLKYGKTFEEKIRVIERAKKDNIEKYGQKWAKDEGMNYPYIRYAEIEGYPK
jgi:hypothetical protein